MFPNVKELLKERGLSVDHATIHRWVVKLFSDLQSKFRQVKKPVGKSWRMDETYIKVKGQWVYYYRAVDKEGQTLDFFYLEPDIHKQPKPSLIKRLPAVDTLKK